MADNHLTVARLVRVISRSIERYERGSPSGALDLLLALDIPQPRLDPKAVADDLELVSLTGSFDSPVPGAALDWIALAIDKIRREQGEDVIGAVVPVRVALRSALICLEG